MSNQYKTEEFKEISVAYIEASENLQYTSNEQEFHNHFRGADSFQNNDEIGETQRIEDDREIELKTTERNPLLFSDGSI